MCQLFLSTTSAQVSAPLSWSSTRCQKPNWSGRVKEKSIWGLGIQWPGIVYKDVDDTPAPLSLVLWVEGCCPLIGFGVCWSLWLFMVKSGYFYYTEDGKSLYSRIKKSNIISALHLGAFSYKYKTSEAQPQLIGIWIFNSSIYHTGKRLKRTIRSKSYTVPWAHHAQVD